MYQNDNFQIAQLEDKILDTVYGYVQHNVPRPFGLLLSGGFDSGLLAAITKPDFIFSIRFSHGVAYDESRYADAIIDHLHLRAKTNIIEITKEDFIANAPAAIKAMGEPVSHFSVVPFYTIMQFVAQRMKDVGVKPTLLSGEGPDEYLGGYARQIIYDELYRLFQTSELRGYHSMIYKALHVPEEAQKLSLETVLAARYGDLMGYNRLDIARYAGAREYPLQGRIGKMDMELGVIEKMEQKLAQHAGVFLHYPYINEEFSEYCYKLPDHLKIRNGVTKWAFRQICKKYLPEFVMDRAKMGGPVAPVNKWLFGKEGYGKEDWLAYQRKVLNEA